MTVARALFVDSFDPPGRLCCRDYDPGPPGADQVRVAIHAAGLSFADVLIIRGSYQVRPPLPFIPGTECAGVIEAVGKDVGGLRAGDRVAVAGWGGMFATHGNFTAVGVCRIADSLSFAAAATISSSYTTAMHALVDRGALRAGETLLVLGAGGATGLAAVQIGHYLGARVIASASSAAKRALALAGGADVAIDSAAADWRGAVKAVNHGKPVDVVFDPVGGAASEPALRSLAWQGRHLVIGFTSGIAALRSNLLLLKGASLIGVDVRQFANHEPERAAAMRDLVFALAGDGVLHPAIHRCFDLADHPAAIAGVEMGQAPGRIVLMIKKNFPTCHDPARISAGAA